MSKPDEVVKPKNWVESLNCAIEGVIYGFKTQRHIRYHYAIAAAALLLSLFLRLPVVEFVLFAVSIIILLFAEMINTAVEEAVNLIEEKYHITAKNAKDVSAGAVLISSIGVGITVYMIFSKYLTGPATGVIREARAYSGTVAVVSLLLVLIAVVVLKATAGKGKGRPLHGGMPSGHTAIAFSLSTAITLITLDPLVSAFSFIMAVFIGSSRLAGGVHSRIEVIVGAILGCGLTSLIFWIFSLTFK